MISLAKFFLTVAFLFFPSTLLAQVAGGPATQAGRSNLEGWSIEYQMPQGWRVVQSLGRIQMLGSDTEPGAIFVAPGLYTSPNEAIADLTLFYQSMNLVGHPTEPPGETTIAGLRAVTATIASQDQMMRPVHGRFIGMLTPHGTGWRPQSKQCRRPSTGRPLPR
jgi:hypothetical protein